MADAVKQASSPKQYYKNETDLNDITYDSNDIDDLLPSVENLPDINMDGTTDGLYNQVTAEEQSNSVECINKAEDTGELFVAGASHQHECSSDDEIENELSSEHTKSPSPSVENKCLGQEINTIVEIVDAENIARVNCDEEYKNGVLLPIAALGNTVGDPEVENYHMRDIHVSADNQFGATLSVVDPSDEISITSIQSGETSAVVGKPEHLSHDHNEVNVESLLDQNQCDEQHNVTTADTTAATFSGLHTDTDEESNVQRDVVGSDDSDVDAEEIDDEYIVEPPDDFPGFHATYPEDSMSIPLFADSQSSSHPDNGASYDVIPELTTIPTIHPEYESDSEQEGETQKKLYPDLNEIVGNIQLLTDEQLKSLYYNSLLEELPQTVDNFLKHDMLKDSHDFYDLVLNFYRARNHLVSSEQDIHCLQEANEKYTSLVWTTLTKSVTAQGLCMDRYKVTKEHAYEQAEYHEDVLPDLKKTLHAIRTHIHDELSLHAYTSQQAKLEVEVYIYNLYKNSHLLSGIPNNCPLSANIRESHDPLIQSQLKLLRDCISVLFTFLRKPMKDAEFFKTTQCWITKMVSSLLRVGSQRDTGFILNHLLRCPAGVGQWGACLLQVRPPSVNYTSWQTTTLDHFISVVATILLPVKGREEALYQLRCQQNLPDKDHPWIIVDSDGEEDEDPAVSWMYLQENDLVSFLNQIDMAAIFRSVLYITRDEMGHDHYDVTLSSETGILKIYAFATCLIELFGRGLTHFHLGRYRQLNKRLGRFIKLTVCYVSDHWQCFHAYHTQRTSTQSAPTSSHVLDRLQLEFDQLFFRATLCLLCARRMGSWQFLADMPYRCVSMIMRWKLLWLLHHRTEDMSELDFNVTPETCREAIKDPEFLQRFKDNLENLPTSHSIYLLTMFSNIARSHHIGDTQFVECVTQEIYDVAYVSEHTREFCSKVGRELLCSIALEHPYIISKILKQTKDQIEQVGKVTLYLFRGLPLSAWQPLESDWVIIRESLLDHPLNSIDNQLAQLIVEELNWKKMQDHGEYFLDLHTQRQMGVLLVETYIKHLQHKKHPSFYPESTNKNSLTVEQKFSAWCWEVAQKLCLHTLKHIKSQTFVEVPILNNDPRFYPVKQGIKEGCALAAYIGLVSTQHSHSIDGFCTDGIPLFATIVESGHLFAAVNILSCIDTLFYDNTDYLTNNDRFLVILDQLLTPNNLTKKGFLSYEFPGPITELLSAYIEITLKSDELTTINRKMMCMFWISLLTHINRWQHNNNILYLLDTILKRMFVFKEAEMEILNYFSNLYKTLLSSEQDQSVLSSLVSWLSSAHPMPSFIDAQSCPDYAWFAFTIIKVESRFDIVQKIWLEIQKTMYQNPECTVEQALKTACATHKFTTISLPSHRLCIYRWAYQALDMEVDHPLLPLVWQQFFMLYLGRMAEELQLPERNSIGSRFFDNFTYVSLMKKMKKRLDEASGHHHKLANIPRVINSLDMGDDTVQLDVKQDPVADSLRDYHHQLVCFYQTLSFWLDESRLHDSQLYLPALPPQYDAERLAKVFQNDQTPWTEIMNFDEISKQLEELSTVWPVSCGTPVDLYVNTVDEEKLSPCDRILARLCTHDKPLPPPPTDQPKAPLVTMKETILTDQQSLMYALRADFKTLTDYAKLFSMRISKHVALDCSFVELLPSLYRNDLTEVVLSVECTSSFNPTHRCKGPAAVTLRYTEKTKDETMSRKIAENRVEYQQLVIESILPPPQTVCSAAVQVNSIISELLCVYKTSPSATLQHQALDVGSNLFYHIASLVSDDTKYYTPAEQFLSSCIETLGQEFIRNNPSQSQPLLQVILQTPSLVGLLAPNFSPNASPEVFVTIYEDMLAVPFKQGLDVAFTLLSKLDINLWLTMNKPVLSERIQFAEIVIKALATCGKTHPKDIRLVFEVYRAHLQTILSHQFPDHYGSIMKQLIYGSADQKLHVDCWKDFLEVLGCTDIWDDEVAEEEDQKDNQIHRGVMADPGHMMEGEIIQPSRLSLEQLEETVQWISSYFSGARLSNESMASFGLYPSWSNYVPCLSSFMVYLMNHVTRYTGTHIKMGNLDIQHGLTNLLALSNNLFSPWLHTFDNNGQVLVPWIQNDSKTAAIVMKAYVHVLNNIYSMYLELSLPSVDTILLMIWNHYVNTLASPGTPVHILTVIHQYLRTLPWMSLKPDLHAIEQMTQVYDRHHRECFLFLSDIFLAVDWDAILQTYTEFAEVRTLHVSLFKLLVQFAQDPDIIQNPLLAPVLHSAHQYNWSYLDAQSYKSTVTWFINKCDPRCVLQQDQDQPSSRVLRLLCVSSSFQLSENILSDSDTSMKRCTYITCVTQLICRCSYLKDVNPDFFKDIVIKLLTDTEAIVGTVLDPASQQQQTLVLCSEILTLLNNCNPKGLTLHVVTRTLHEWICSSMNAILLIPLLTSACKTIVSVEHMAQLVEVIMEAHFHAVQDLSDQDAYGWGWVVSALYIPDLNQSEFLTACVQYQCLLTLYAYTLQQSNMTDKPEQAFQQLLAISTWHSNIKISAENEGKLLLIWCKMMELCARQCTLGGDTKPVGQLLIQTVVPSLARLGEDKNTSGFLGAIGLGKKSQLSLKFRMIVRAISLYLQSQVPSDTSVRCLPNSLGAVHSTVTSGATISPTPQTLQASQQFEALRNQKTYAEFRDDIEYIIAFVHDPRNALPQLANLLMHFVRRFYSEAKYLSIIQASTTS